jgi:hypothetical protein
MRLVLAHYPVRVIGQSGTRGRGSLGFEKMGNEVVVAQRVGLSPGDQYCTEVDVVPVDHGFRAAAERESE